MWCNQKRNERVSTRNDSVDSFFAKDEEGIKSRVRKASFWATCYEKSDVVPDFNPSNVDAEAYCNKVSFILNEDGNPTYCQLSKLALMILLLPHGNADPEWGFSVNRKILKNHSNNIDEDTFESVRTVKDFLIQSGSQSGIKVQKEMIQQCKCSRPKYQKYLEEERAQKKEEKQIIFVHNEMIFYSLSLFFLLF